MSEKEQAEAAKLLLAWVRLMRTYANTLGPEVRNLVEQTAVFVGEELTTPHPEVSKP